jgi:hypothetical protein
MQRTNGRTCVTCHQGADGWLSAQHAQQRFATAAILTFDVSLIGDPKPVALVHGGDSHLQ